MSTRLVPSAPISIYKTSPEPVGPTCQLCDNTGHAARSCPTYLNESSTNLALTAQVSRLTNDCRKHAERLAKLDDQVKGLIKTVEELSEELGGDRENWTEYYSIRK